MPSNFCECIVTLISFTSWLLFTAVLPKRQNIKHRNHARGAFIIILEREKTQIVTTALKFNLPALQSTAPLWDSLFSLPASSPPLYIPSLYLSFGRGRQISKSRRVGRIAVNINLIFLYKAHKELCTDTKKKSGCDIQ